jgi:hypothetical protein
MRLWYADMRLILRLAQVPLLAIIINGLAVKVYGLTGGVVFSLAHPVKFKLLVEALRLVRSQEVHGLRAKVPCAIDKDPPDSGSNALTVGFGMDSDRVAIWIRKE